MTELPASLALPANLPVPIDDGACDHLRGMRLPSIPLASTAGETVDLAALRSRTVVYVYPRTGRPEEPPSDEWNAIAGARGCTPQSCGFRDHFQELRSLGAGVFGISTQTTRYQQEAVERLHLPFPLLSDSDLAFTRALRLPTFEFEPYRRELRTLMKRLALVIRDGIVEKVFYPVFPPDRNAEQVVNWLREHPMSVESVASQDSATFRSHRVLRSSPEQVFGAFSTPDVLARWWGPAGFSNTFEVFEFTPGGRWKYMMHGPQGAQFANESVFVEVDPGRIVIQHMSKPRYLLTVILAPDDGGTAITWVQVFEDSSVAARIRHIVGPANEQNLDRLEAVLSGKPLS